MPAADHPIEYVKQNVGEKYKDLFGHKARVSITLTAREPVYVVGLCAPRRV